MLPTHLPLALNSTLLLCGVCVFVCVCVSVEGEKGNGEGLKRGRKRG